MEEFPIYYVGDFIADHLNSDDYYQEIEDFLDSLPVGNESIKKSLLDAIESYDELSVYSYIFDYYFTMLSTEEKKQVVKRFEETFDPEICEIYLEDVDDIGDYEDFDDCDDLDDSDNPEDS